MWRMLAFFFIALFFVAECGAQSISTGEDHGSEITVSSEANVYANPDVAQFNLSIVARLSRATEAFKTYLLRYNALASSLGDIVDTTKLMTDNLTIAPSFDYRKPDQVNPDYYQVSSSMSISVPISDLNGILGRIASVDGVTINGVIFRAKNQDSLETMALKEAVKRARAKAEAIAQLEGMTNLKLKSMTTSYSHPPVPFRAMAMTVAAQQEPSVNPSSISVSASVTATYLASPK